MEDPRTPSPRIALDYIKAHHFRVIHADGMIGNVTASGGVHLAFFSERAPIPRREVRIITPEGALGEYVREGSDVRDAIIREVDVGVMMSVEVAEALIIWLQARVAESRSRSLPETSGGGQQP